MQVAKLSTGPIVQLLKIGPVMFAEGTWALVLPRLERPLAHRNDPYWVPTSSVAWTLNFSQENQHGTHQTLRP